MRVVEEANRLLRPWGHLQSRNGGALDVCPHTPSMSPALPAKCPQVQGGSHSGQGRTCSAGGSGGQGGVSCSWDRVYLAQLGAEISGVKEGMQPAGWAQRGMGSAGSLGRQGPQQAPEPQACQQGEACQAARAVGPHKPLSACLAFGTHPRGWSGIAHGGPWREGLLLSQK